MDTPLDLLHTYQEELKKDIELNEMNLKEVQMKLPSIKHKWVSRLILAKKDLHEIMYNKKAAKNKVIEEIKKNTPVKLSDLTIEKTAESHSSVTTMDGKIIYQELLVNYLEKVENILARMSYDIKNLVDLTRMETT